MIMDTKPAATDRQRSKEMWIRKIRRELDQELRERVPDKLIIRPSDSPAVRAAKEDLLRREATWQAMTPEQRADRMGHHLRTKQELSKPTLRQLETRRHADQGAAEGLTDA